MAKGTTFGSIHSHRNLNLIQQKVEVAPAEPKTNLIDIPGADGSKDLSAQPTGHIVYHDRKITWTFALYPGENWDEKHRQVSSALNGLACHITLDSDPGYYYDGRLTVKKYKLDGLLRQITVEATCRPYMLKQQATKATATLTTTAQSITLTNERMYTVPTFVASTSTTIVFGGKTATFSGTFSSLDVELQPGDNLLQAKTTSGAGTLTITYQEGAL